ncbi:UNKNOWN [Stylonychia lemnae]|uniref:Uncharacterized protein n=1 Tax=Stylonychia lemnae TaxID=5949 RepID=A0A078A6Q1_STYLE|nr:UNKNOWN [Stylonychia lemnae]|eukprot:CDW77930.1 UNKNOWN [Stylonychia lemnae]
MSTSNDSLMFQSPPNQKANDKPQVAQQLVEARQIQQRMRNKMQNMLSSVKCCHKDLKEQLLSKKEQFELQLVNECTSVEQIYKQFSTMKLNMINKSNDTAFRKRYESLISPQFSSSIISQQENISKHIIRPIQKSREDFVRNIQTLNEQHQVNLKTTQQDLKIEIERTTKLCNALKMICQVYIDKLEIEKQDESGFKNQKLQDYLKILVVRQNDKGKFIELLCECLKDENMQVVGYQVVKKSSDVKLRSEVYEELQELVREVLIVLNQQMIV